MIEILDGLANNHAKLEKLDEDDFGDHSLASLSKDKRYNSLAEPTGDENENDQKEEDEHETRSRFLRRSKTMPTTAAIQLTKNLGKENSILMQSFNNLSSTVNLKLNMSSDRFKLAKDEAERAIKERKIFTIVGPYQSLRNALRRRGWVEKFDNSAQTSSSVKKTSVGKKKNNMADELSSSDDDADEEENEDIKPWEENNGYFGIMSRIVKSFSPNFIWTVKATTLDYPYLTKDQIVNHYNKNGAFTTKIGLCSNIRNISWYCSENCDDFFPRCYKLCQEDDRKAFIDDYRITSCVSLLKYFVIKYRNESEEDFLNVHITSADELKRIRQKEENEKEGNESSELAQNHSALQSPSSKISHLESLPVDDNSVPKPAISHKRSSSICKISHRNSLACVPLEAIEFAIEQIDSFVDFKENNDLDKADFDLVGDEKWQKFSEWFYAACHDKKPIQPASESLYNEVIKCLEVVKEYCPQYNIDGFRNIWIVKPGALSRGRGIIVFDKLENILELNRSPLQRDGKYVVQKYIERPLLIHKIKFDIRQWFLVTDFNPLTIWMYKDCYLRFCTQKFTLDSTQQSVHLCNYSIQKNYKNDTARDNELPEENMWSSEEFMEKYLSKQGLSHKWDDLIYPGMKQAILSSMLSAQDIVEPRKNSFELYGADFILGDDLKPWLIEINCSPTMAKSTEVTKILCDVVLEDVCRVILDRRANKTADTGRFELIYKANPVTVPNYIGIDLKIDGFGYKKAQQQLLSPQQSNSTNSYPAKNQQISPSANLNNSLINIKSYNPSPNETINITSLDVKNNSNRAVVKSSKLISPVVSTTLSEPKQTISYSKETTLPSISLNKLMSRESVLKNRSEIVNFYKSIEDQTRYLLKLSESKQQMRHSVSDVRFRNKESRMGSINEPKLFEFKNYEVPINKVQINRPFLIKKASLPYHQIIKLSKSRQIDDKIVNNRSEFSVRLGKRFRKQRGKQIMLNKLEVSDLKRIELEK